MIIHISPQARRVMENDPNSALSMPPWWMQVNTEKTLQSTICRLFAVSHLVC